jgi:myo-inositol-1(or 4)-monophosphatase
VSSESADTAALLKLATKAALAGGQLLLSHWTPSGPAPHVLDSVGTKSSRTDLVTAVDRASEELIVACLRAERPDDAILGEEGGSAAGTSGITWVIDPLDGTVNFVYGIPAFSVSIACRDATGTLAGVVHDPLRGETFVATAGGGAACNDLRLRLEPGPDLAEALISTGFGYGSARRGVQAQLLATVLPAVRDIRRGGSAALDLCWVAAARLDGLFEAGLAEWDSAAGALIVTEAGGQVVTVDGLIEGEPAVTTIFATAPGLLQSLQALVVKAAASAL